MQASDPRQNLAKLNHCLKEAQHRRLLGDQQRNLREAGPSASASQTHRHMKPCVLEHLAAFVRRYLSCQKNSRDMMHGYYFGVLKLQPITLVSPAPDSPFAATSDLVVGGHGPEDRAS